MTQRGCCGRRVGIVGAGAGGLSAARHLLQGGYQVTVFEAGSHVGGLWVYDNDNGLGVAYDSLHINSDRRATAFRGYPFPAGTPMFPSHRQVAAYLDDAADVFGLRPHIRLNHRVTNVSPVRDRSAGAWRVHVHGGGGGGNLRCRRGGQRSSRHSGTS